MIIRRDGCVLILTREAADPKFRDESALLYALKEKLNAEGGDFVKKRMGEDGHLVSDAQHYVRTRGPKSRGPHWAIFNGRYAIEGAEQEWNANGKTILSVVDAGWQRS